MMIPAWRPATTSYATAAVLANLDLGRKLPSGLLSRLCSHPAKWWYSRHGRHRSNTRHLPAHIEAGASSAWSTPREVGTTTNLRHHCSPQRTGHNRQNTSVEARHPSGRLTAFHHLEVAVTTKCRSGRTDCSLLITASLPTPLGPLMTASTDCCAGTCVAQER